MKRLFKGFIIFILMMLLVFGLNLKASQSTPNLILQNGASLRTTGERPGIKFMASIDSLSNVTEHGFLVAKGQYSLEEMTNGSVEKIQNVKINGDKLSFNLVIFGMDSADDYLSDLTVVAYAKTADNNYYYDIAVTRSMAEVAISAKNENNQSTLVGNVVTSINNEYRKVGFDENENFVIDSLIESNPFVLSDIFVADWNKMFGTSFDKLDGMSFKVNANTGLESNTDEDATVSNLYKFFNSSKYGAKWQWLLEYLLTLDDVGVHPKRQIKAILSETGTASDSYGSQLYLFDHLSYSIVNFFNATSVNGEYKPITFDDMTKYDTVENYSKVYSNINNYDLVKVGSEYVLPQINTELGYGALNYVSNDSYNVGDSIVITNSNIEFEVIYGVIDYSITYYNGEEELTDLTETYNINSDDIVLPILEVEDYIFEGWYENNEFSGEKVEKIVSGETGNKVYYAKLTKIVYTPVEITYDLNGGYWSQSFVEENATTTSEFVLTKYLSFNNSGYEASLHTLTNKIYWYYIVLEETKIENVYEIIEIVYQNKNITSTSFDYVITWHSDLTNADTKTILSSIYKNASNYIGDYVTFDNIPSTAGDYTINVKTYESEEFTKNITRTLTERESLEVPVKGGDTFKGWESSVDGNVYYAYPGYVENPGNITYIAQWFSDYTASEKINDTLSYLDSLYGSIYVIENDLDLVTAYGDIGCDISWNSSDESIFSNSGVYTRPYKDTNITLTATISVEDESSQVVFSLTATGYKSLSGPIASSYVYTNYSKTTDAFFEINDIINCAFIIANADGTLVTTDDFISNVNTYIFERARDNGCWVIMSISPSSPWTTLCNPDNELIDTFTTNIVNIINTYGFDGVDIDWEFPSSSQKTWFVSLMESLYTKVKANNPNHLVTAAIGGGKWQPPGYDLVNSCQYLDYINMMCYGMCSSEGQYQNALYGNTSKNDSTNKVGYTLTSCSIDESVKIFTNTYGVPSNKIIAGMAFYAVKQTRTYTDEAWSSWSFSSNLSYTTISQNYLNNSEYIYVYDTRCQVPYLLKTDGTVFISFDDPRSISAKCQYAIDKGLGGVMYWQNGQDTTGDLLNAVKETFNK